MFKPNTLINLIGSITLMVMAPMSVLASGQQFGFLVGDSSASNFKFVEDVGAKWVRPHPGPFVWGNMQSSRTADISFDETDDYVQAAQAHHVHILATLWPYADWDQQGQSQCRNSDEFKQALGNYRCNPQNEKAYRAWVKALVERYDGDGQADMPGLQTPIRYWEIDNEPDLRSDSLQFYIGGPTRYAKLLRLSAKAIHNADPKANIVLAGASDGNAQALDYYRQLFSETNTIEFVDIVNIHCISNGDVDTLNVADYQALLADFAITKPVWVTEAESYVSDDPDINAAQLHYSVQQALALGAKKIFFTGMNFATAPGSGGVGQMGSITEPDPSLDGDHAKAAYRIIIE